MRDSSSSATLTLSQCASGEEVQIIAVRADTTLAARLGEMGLCPGSVVRLLRRGSPLIVLLGETRLCLRGPEACAIEVRPVFDFAIGDGAMEEAAL